MADIMNKIKFLSPIEAPNIDVTGDIRVQGESIISSLETVVTKENTIKLRDGATGALMSNEYTGIIAEKYDGTNNGMLVFDSSGTAYVGDEGDLQPLATRVMNADDNGKYAYWDSESQTLKPGLLNEKNNAVYVGDNKIITSADSATSAEKLTTARKISLTGHVVGNASFDGSGDISIKTSNGQHITKSGNGAYYIEIGTMVADDGSNYGNIYMEGRFGGWVSTNTAYFEILLLNRANNNGNTITATVSASGLVEQAMTYCDIVVYKQEDTSAKVYFKTNGFWLYDFDWSAYQHSITYTGQTSTETPTGTLVWSLSEAPKTILDKGGKFFANKIETGTSDDSYFQTRRFRGQGDASAYNHAIDFGYEKNDKMEFYEWGGVFNFYKCKAASGTGTSTKEDAILIGAITENGFEGNATSATKDGAGNIITDTYVRYVINNNVSVGGTTKPVYRLQPPNTDGNGTISSGSAYFPEGIIMGGSALTAGLMTRGICGITTADANTGACDKENLYLNYDGSNTYKSDRQVVLQASEIGTHYGNNVYQYAAVRGDALKNYCDNLYYNKITIDEKINTKAPAYTYGTTDIGEGASLPTGQLYFVYEE